MILASIVPFFVLVANSLRLYPFSIAKLGISTSASNIYIGSHNTGATGYKINNNYTGVIDMGECDFYRYDYNFIDYNISATLYVPYCNSLSINPQLYLGKHLALKMLVDIVTGQCTAVLFADGVIMAYTTGVIGVDIPISAKNISSRGISAIKSVVNGGFAFAGAKSVEGATASAIAYGGQMVNSAIDVGREIILTHGTSSPSCCMYQPDTPYLIINRPKYSVPDNYGHTVGFRTAESKNVGDCIGFTLAYNVDVSGITATADECAQIKSILESGFYA